MWIIMDENTAEQIRGMYNGSMFMPIKTSDGLWCCSIDNLNNPAFSSIHETLAECEIVDNVTFDETSNETI